ncbi:MAG TPA: NAD(+)--dinitrogen-reductase ADP-D-ribosyltransferase [Candidatus Methylomirabilis sp.]|nr:NAD(+)--dinitrogen-reductase ADP-D-ribosyltransferase [Candidatus Methylomirabilis sp.]
MADRVLPVNRCDLPPWVIASHRFNQHPLPIEIQGVRRSHRSLFSRLARLEDPAARAVCFRDYMELVFRAGKWRSEKSPGGRRSLRNGYLRFLRGWMLDASSAEGAVLKGWVESRFGIPPAYHAGFIEDIHAPAYLLYLAERMRGSARTNAVEAQFDLLYEFVQDELRRRHPGIPSFTLYRGVRNLADYRVLANPGGNRAVVRLNNLNSFSSRLEHAWQFGGNVFVADVPAAKIFFRADLLPGVLPRREEEAMVIGGDFEVTVRSY